MLDSTQTVPMKGTLLQGRRGLIMGVANERSLAWGIAAACAGQGAELAFTYQGDALGRRVRPLADSVGSTQVLPCDVGDDAAMDAAFDTIGAAWGGLDFLVHAIGFADKQFLRGRYADTPREAFLQALDISCYSFTAVCRRAAAVLMDERRLHADAELLRCRKSCAALQRYGRGERRRWKPRCAILRRISGRAAFG